MMRKYEPSAQTYNNFLEDSALTPISTTHSIFNGLTEGVGTNILAAQEIGSVLTGVPLVDENVKNTMEMVQKENENPLTTPGQTAANTISNMIGSGLGTGYLGKLAGRGLGMVVGQAGKKVLPSAITNFSKKPLTRIFGEDVQNYLPKAAIEEGKRTMNIGEFGQHLAQSYGMGAGFALPEAVKEHYNENQNTLNWGGIAKETLGYGGAMGIAIDVFPYTAGVLWGKTKSFMGKVDKMPLPGSLKGVEEHPLLEGAIKAHQSGKITKEELKWFQDYLTKPEDMQSLKDRGVSILMKDGHPVDPGQLHVMLELMKPDDAQSFLTGVADQLGSAVDKAADSSLSQYVVDNGLDRLQSDPKLINGLKGFYDFIEHKLNFKNESLEKLKAIKESKNIAHINSLNPFSQKNIYKMFKKFANEESHTSSIPLTVPENIAKRIKIEKKISDLKQRMKNEKKLAEKEGREYKPNKQTVKRIQELEKKKPALLKPKNELDSIEKKLIKDGKTIDNFRSHNAYQRLHDLAQISDRAKVLLHHVELMREYEKQEGFKNIADVLIQMSEKGFRKLSDGDKVVSYLKNRIEESAALKPEAELAEGKIKEEPVPADAEKVLEQQEIEQKSESEMHKEVYAEAKSKFDEFKKSENIFKNFMQCIEGSKNG